MITSECGRLKLLRTQMQAEASYWTKRGRKYKVSEPEVSLKATKNLKSAFPYGYPTDHTLGFYTKYLRQTLTCHNDPFLDQKHRDYRQANGEVLLGQNFLPRMTKDIGLRRHGPCSCLEVAANA